MVRRIGGDREAFEGLVRSEHSRLRAFAGRLLDGGPAADDALQDAYLKAYRAFPPASDDRLDAWLATIVYRSCMDSIRLSRRRATVPLESERASTGWNGSADHGVPAAIDLAAAFRQLPVLARAAVVLVDVLGLDYETAAQILDTNRGTVASRLHTARELLRQHLSAYHEETRTDDRHPDSRDKLVGAAVARLPLEPEADDFFDRLTDTLDSEDAALRRTPWWGGHKRRGAVMIAAIGVACLAVGGLAGAALAHRSNPQSATPRLQSAERIAYTVVGGRRIAAFHTSHAAETPSGNDTPGFGLTVPTGWDGRLLFPNTPGEMPDIQAGNFNLPPDQATDGSGAIQDQMGPSDVFIWIGDDGPPATWMLTYPGWQQTTMPITISPSDYRGTYEGQTVPLFLLRHVIVDNHALLVGVEFGTSTPTPQTYADVNQILSTLTLT